MFAFDAAKAAENVTAWIRDWFSANGPSATAVIGISGGKDSTVCAALLAKALGKERVFGIIMPNGEMADIDDAKAAVEFLGIRFAVVNIQKSYMGLLEGFAEAVPPVLEKAAGGGDAGESFAKAEAPYLLREDARINIPPRLRMTTLYAIAQNLPEGGRVANTCNASEDYVGYSTKFGDAAGDFSPLSSFTVTEILAIGEYLGLPASLVHKTPSDGLSGMSDEEKLGFTYAVLDKYIRTGICEDPDVKANIDRKHRANLHKLLPMPKYEN